ncbi:Acetyl-CoA:oxalate CoA-transferase [Pseudomonas fluorescens]|uniref:Acetyl-CoA:oxalate CoA-transferase n=1 Tax=Pseudomonas fluorescens TaxID=294 RepID=A0A5E6R5W6_PSEFL|nr:CaiB/BaiF CoA-transferase family protein [Pseudomonas fluorescens]VVM60625.1 Acetyl-CoA:oxalate CoA-transferase [Pseudomonas fluorescens]VVP21915.1 Acetyl-CoA:oxalate CoA-transferase [Pseudomonas fluorescens]
MPGPLAGVKVVEMNAIGPAPFAAMMLADMGAEVIRVDRHVAGFLNANGSLLGRGRRSIAIDPRKPGATEVLLQLIDGADVLIEGFRPGVMERLGLGPDVCLERNPRLVYGRMTGWGQSGPLAQAAGHDLNYIALSGVLNAMGHADRPPTPPLHLVGDMGGGAMFLVTGILAGLFEAQKSGLGQVVDAAICDGATLLGSMYYDWRHQGQWDDQRQHNMLDGGAPFYGCYTCADGKFVSIGAIEPQFYQLLLELCGIDDPDFRQQWHKQDWPLLRQKLETLFMTRTRDAWTQLLEGTDACFAPVLDFSEAFTHPHNRARGLFMETAGVLHPAPAPRLSRTPVKAGRVVKNGENTLEILEQLGLSIEQLDELRDVGAIV